MREINITMQEIYIWKQMQSVGILRIVIVLIDCDTANSMLNQQYQIQVLYWNILFPTTLQSDKLKIQYLKINTINKLFQAIMQVK